MITLEFLTALEILGTVAFAVSGALVAIKAKFDIFGVLVIGCITAVGGGIMRDVLIGVIPPSIFGKVHLIMIALSASLVSFIAAYFTRKRFYAVKERIDSINNLFDALGLAAFTVMGMEVAFFNGLSDNIFLSVVLGVLTGVGGGLLRDVLTETPPYIFRKHVYAIASIAGALFYYVLQRLFENSYLSTVLSLVTIILIRMLATLFRWKLPKIKIDYHDGEIGDNRPID